MADYVRKTQQETATVYLLHYNNYFNRTIKIAGDELSAYSPFLVKSNNVTQSVFKNINFNPGNNINAELIINWGTEYPDTDPDYIVVSSTLGFTSATDTVGTPLATSRWFVISADRTRAKQYRLALRRDIVADYYNDVVSAPCFIEKATLPNNNDLIFNPEAMTFNRIKQSEQLIKDDTGCPWIVIYGARYTRSNAGDLTPTSFTINFNTTYDPIDIPQALFNKLNSYAGSANNNNGVRTAAEGSNTAPQIDIVPAAGTGTTVIAVNISAQSGINYDYIITQKSLPASSAASSGAFTDDYYNIIRSLAANVKGMQELQSSYVTNYDPEVYDFVLKNNGKYLRAPNGTIFLLNAGTPQQDTFFNHTSITSGALYNILQPFTAAFISPTQATIGRNGNIRPMFTSKVIYFTLNAVENPTGAQETLVIGQNRLHCIDAPYDIFCLPLSDDLIIHNSRISSWANVTSSSARNLQVASALMAAYNTVGQIYDAQLLPYCPLDHYQMEGDIFDLNNLSAASYDQINTSSGVTGYIFYALKSSFTKTIGLANPVVVSDPKIESQTDMYRLCSPNYSSAFEINAAMNDGIYNITVTATYKPLNPYIKLYPDFKRLYGDDFNDARGLICGGDYSLVALNDAWETYQLENKNYQMSFDREIQNLEVQQGAARTMDIFGSLAGAASGAASGAALGSMIAPGIGTLVGGLAGGGISAIGGGVDVYINERLRDETIDYTRDRFGYQLGNIKALPQTLTRTSAYNIDNKYFPFLEHYTCTEIEKQALRDKIKYNGMSVMAIGTIAQHQQTEPTYIKGQIIRLDGISGNYDICRAIYDEINKGVYI